LKRRANILGGDAGDQNKGKNTNGIYIWVNCNQKYRHCKKGLNMPGNRQSEKFSNSLVLRGINF
jgi:hypothetical protein